MKISDLFGTSRVITFTGLAKNVGKTTAMQTALQELAHASKRYGITSSGRNGESFDVLNQDIPKPQIDFPAGTLLATTDQLLAKSAAPVQRLETTPYRTPLGHVVIAEVLQTGKIEVAGPSTSSGLKAVAQRMLALGAEYVLIDGAINRKAAGSPLVSDSMVLSTGAVLSPDLETVVYETSSQVNIFRIPQIEDPAVIKIFSQLKGLALVDQDYQVTPVTAPSLLDIGRMLVQSIEKKTSWVLIPTAVTDHMLKPIARINRQKRLIVAVADATKVFISGDKLSYYQSRGIDLRVIRPIHLLCVTANPISPNAHSFDPSDFTRRLRLAIPDIPIVDVIFEASSFN